MTASLLRTTGHDAWDLIYPQHLSMLSSIDQETMRRHMMNSSRIWIGYEDEKVLCYLGLIPPTILSDRAYLWLQVTEHMKSHVFIFVRYSQKVVAEMLEEYPVIVGHTELHNRRAIRWLKWLGAEFGQPIDGRALPFEIRKP